ncbi:MAG: hypothetical protein U9R52_04710, partial [Candidatus Omnitrophota bacterium]|nr:hypothetical protein [Candidatus Omnitrophota bacterium]
YISGDEETGTWKYALFIIPAILIMGYRYKNSSFMPLSLVLSLSVIYIALSISSPFGLLTNRMERAAGRIKAEIKEGDRIGIGSHGIIPEKLQVFFEIPVENVKVRYSSGDVPDLGSVSGLRQFLDSGDRVFCVIKRRDYENFLSESAKEKLYILDRYFVWKRRVRLDNELKKSFRKKGIARLIKVLQNEIYVISNKNGKI